MAGQAASAVPDATRGECSFGVLGPLLVLRDGRALALGGRQQRAVLARLLVQTGAVVTVDQLLLALWGERPTDGAVTTVQTYVSHLREVLEPDRSRGAAPQLLLTEPRGYRLAVPDLAVDAVVFEQAVSAGRCALAAGRFEDASTGLDRALRLWRGEVLSDLADFDFTLEASARLAGLRLSALEDRFEADLALGRHRQVADELDSLTAAHPLRERLHAQRILALYRSGRQAEALAAYGCVQQSLADELGIDPNPDLAALHLAILRQDPALHAQPTVPPAGVESRDEQRAVDSGERASGAAVVGRRAPVRRWVAAASVTAAVLSLLAASAHPSGGAPGLQDQAHGAPPVLGANSVGRVDARSGGLSVAMPVGQGASALASGGGALWVANEREGTVSRLDPQEGRVVQRVEVGAGPVALAAVGEDVWVVNGGAGTVSRVNARTDRVVQTVTVGDGPSAVAAAPEGVWVANSLDDTVQRIDPRSGRADRPIDVGAHPAGVAVAGGTVWVTNMGDATVSRVDARTGEVRDPIAVGAGPRGVAATQGAVWVADSLELGVTRIDPVSGRVVGEVRVGDGPRSVVAGAGAVWVVDEYDGTLDRIDPVTNAVTRDLRLGSSPRAVAATGSSVWVATGGSVGPAHRGGTLVVDSDVVPTYDDVDPASNWNTDVMTMAYDGLVALRRTGGSDATTLVPDLATALPRPTDGGLTYAFALRRGIRYSDGGTVLATDVQRGVERALFGRGQQYFTGIVGARRCVARPSDCSLSRGVVADDERSRLTFHLTSADPDFLAKLSVFAFATPPGVTNRQLHRPMPGTGPYRIVGRTAANARLRLTMVRNPFFRQWSFAAKPDGYADGVQWRRVRLASQRRADLLSGRADLSDPYTSTFSARANAALAREHPSLLHVDPSMATYYQWLNTRIPPFDHVRARRALNLAVDRDRLVQLLGGRIQVVPSCQVFTPNTLGYQPYCPYTAEPSSDGRYHGPDLRRARALVRASGTAGTRVSVWSDDAPGDLTLGRYFARVLRSLGYRATSVVRSVSGPSQGRSDQMGGSWWGVDFPTPSSAWAPLLSCRFANTADAAATPNHGGFCDHRVEQLARRAGQAGGTDPAASRRLWTRVDKRLTDDAPWVAGPATRFVCLVSPRVGNYQSNPVLGPLVDQMWVR